MNLKTGRTLHPGDIIEASALETLSARINKALKAEVKKSLREHGAEMSGFREGLAKARFTVKDLEDFLIEEHGIAFFFDFGFPHVVQALEPSETYFLSYAELKPYLRRDGPLGPVAARSGAIHSGRPGG